MLKERNRWGTGSPVDLRLRANSGRISTSYITMFPCSPNSTLSLTSYPDHWLSCYRKPHRLAGERLAIPKLEFEHVETGHHSATLQRLGFAAAYSTKEGTRRLRPCKGFHALSSRTLPDRWPLLPIHEFFENLARYI